MSNDGVMLTALDGANPLGYLAALGLLRVLDFRLRVADEARRAGEAPRLSWSEEGCWRPVLHHAGNSEAIIGAVIEDKATWSDDPAALLAYDESGEHLVDPRTAKGAYTRDLKPKPAAMRRFLHGLAVQADVRQTNRDRAQLRRSLDTAAAFGSELVQDNNGNTKPTTFHFTAGQQQFLKAIAEIQAGASEADFWEALMGPWVRQSPLPNMSWDATNARSYALRAKNPSGDKKTTVAGADWLAFVGLGLFPVSPRGSRLQTTGIKGGWKTSVFTWAVWEAPVTYREARCIVASARLSDLTADERRSRGIGAVFSSRITRSDQGGYGSFAPAEIR